MVAQYGSRKTANWDCQPHLDTKIKSMLKRGMNETFAIADSPQGKSTVIYINEPLEQTKQTHPGRDETVLL